MNMRAMAAAVAASLALAMAPGVASAAVSDAPASEAPTVDGAVLAVDKLGSTVYIGGSFASVTDSAGVTHRRRGAAAIDVTTGDVLPWNPRVRGDVRDIEATREGVYLAGRFSRVRTTARSNLARVNRVRGQVHRSFKVRTNGAVETLALSNGRIYLGGHFTKVGKRARSQAAAVKRGGRFKLTAWAPRAENGPVHELVRHGSALYVAGQFRRLNGSVDSRHLALVDGKRGTTVRRFAPDVPHAVFDLEVTSDHVYGAMGGPSGGAVLAFDTVRGVETWTRRLDGDVRSVEIVAGELFAGGHFSEVCASSNPQDQDENGTCLGDSVRSQRGASFVPATGDQTSWNPEANGAAGIVELAAVGRGRLAAGGDFTVPRGGFAIFAPVD